MVQVKFIVLLVCALTLTQAFEAEGTLLSMSLNEINNLNLGDVNCQNTSQQQFVQLEQNLESWADIIDHKDDIQKDINTLKQLEVILLQVKKQTQKKKIAPQQLKQINQVVTKKIKSLVLPQTASKIGQAHCDEIERQLERLSSDNESERSECCDALLKLATFLIRQLSSINQQCHQNPVTVIKIKGQIKELHIIQGGCGGGQTIDIPMGGSDEKCDKPETPTKPTDPTTPDTPTDDPVPDPEKEEETTDEETTDEETTTEEGETTPPGPDAEEEGEPAPPGPDAEEEGETTPPGPDAEEEGETTPPGPDAEEEGETTPPGPDAEEEGETTPPGPDAEEEGETTPPGPDAEEEGETTPPGPDAEEEGETTPPGPDAEEEGETTTPSAEEELHEPAEEEEESFEGGEKNNTKGPGDIPDEGEEEGFLPEEEFSPEDGPQPEEEGAATEEGTPAGEEEGTPAGEEASEEEQEQTVPGEEGLPEGEEEESEFPGDIPSNKNGTSTLPDLPEGEEGAEEEGEEGGEEPEKPVKPRSRASKPAKRKGDEGEEGEEGTQEGEEGTPEGEDGEEAGEEEEGWVPGDIPKGKNGTSTLPDLPEGEEGAEEGSEEVGEESGEEGGEEGDEIPEEDTEETADQPEEQEEKCQETVEITATNAADIMCALGQYLSQLAHGGSPSDSPNAKKVCFCLKYEPDNADPSLLQLTQKVSKKQRKEQDGILKALIPNRRI
ncbi:unnamed protein product [Paramecium pentaurelia]|uniref:Uncharacterized protein n=1 Tax=Paramecium pentaurelia TaxID=43138 RepID=A0A8S1W9X1_9CILI|nr:unnamed protein product [Paramecium pentaurelia]